METKINNEKRCENCKYYLQHYTLRKDKYITVFCGHCLNDNKKSRIKKPNAVCEFWSEKSLI